MVLLLVIVYILSIDLAVMGVRVVLNAAGGFADLNSAGRFWTGNARREEAGGGNTAGALDGGRRKDIGFQLIADLVHLAEQLLREGKFPRMDGNRDDALEFFALGAATAESRAATLHVQALGCPSLASSRWTRKFAAAVRSVGQTGSASELHSKNGTCD